MSKESPTMSTPSWNAVVLVCKSCRKRSSGPKGLKSKDAVSEARSAVKAMSPRPRVLLTGCMGLCPKRALAVAVVGGDAPVKLMAVETLGQIAGLVAPAV